MNAHVQPSSAQSTSGVWHTSTPAAYDSYYIFCVGNDKLREAAFKAWALDKGIGFKEVVGSYKGQTEAAFIVNTKWANECRPWYENEESILLLSAMRRKDGYSVRHAQLVFANPLDRPTQDLGMFHETSKEAAMKRDCWTFDPTTNKYWITER